MAVRTEDQPKVWLWWSSGKDSAWALHLLKSAGEVRVTGLVTTVSPTFDRVAIHGVRTDILERQSEAVGVPLHRVEIPFPCSNEAYEAAVQPLIEAAGETGVVRMAFGDLFLEEVRAYRTRLLEGSGIEPAFPVWGEETGVLARRMIDAGTEAYITSLDPRVVPSPLAGRRFDHALLAELPEGVDPCGENGEFHTCVVDGPSFTQRIEVERGEVVERSGFVYADFRLV